MCSIAFGVSAESIRNIVLVHGAFADDVAATRRVLGRQDGPAILVGHSYGGSVITEAGTDPKVAGLVYVAAFAPEIGQSTLDQYAEIPPPPNLVPEEQSDGFAYLNADRFRAGLPRTPMTPMRRSCAMHRCRSRWPHSQLQCPPLPGEPDPAGTLLLRKTAPSQMVW